MTAIILTGGNSSRMGYDKLSLKLNGKRLIDHVIGNVRAWSQFIIIAGNACDNLPDMVRTIPDQGSGCGPLMGIHSGLSASPTRLNFVIAVDIPSIHPHLISRLLRFTPNYDIVLPGFEPGFAEPLMGIYKKNVLPHAGQLLKSGHYKISRLFELCPTHIELFTDKSWYHNLNTPKDVFSFSKQSGIQRV